MILTITKIELISYSKLFAFIGMSSQIIKDLKQSECKKYKMTRTWNLKVWYTMTLWENDQEINHFYRHGKHLEAMKKSKLFSSQIQSLRLQVDDLIKWEEAKKLFK